MTNASLSPLQEEREKQLEFAVLDIIQEGRQSCSLGFGKYPLGVRYAVQQLVPRFVNTARVLEALKDFDERLAR